MSWYVGCASATVCIGICLCVGMGGGLSQWPSHDGTHVCVCVCVWCEGAVPLVYCRHPVGVHNALAHICCEPRACVESGHGGAHVIWFVGSMGSLGWVIGHGLKGPRFIGIQGVHGVHWVVGHGSSDSADARGSSAPGCEPAQPSHIAHRLPRCLASPRAHAFWVALDVCTQGGPPDCAACVAGASRNRCTSTARRRMHTHQALDI